MTTPNRHRVLIGETYGSVNQVMGYYGDALDRAPTAVQPGADRCRLGRPQSGRAGRGNAIRDPWELQVPALGLGRDPVRTPMPWSDGPSRGFTTGPPWLPFGTITPADVQRELVSAQSFGGVVAYDAAMAFTRISIDHRIMAGVPCIRGTRIPVAMLVRMVANGKPIATLLEDYPQLSEEDVREALRFAAARVDERTIPLDITA